jgi:hypothetical protein
VDIRYTTSDGINDCIEGAVISHAEVNDNGATIYFEDGRAIVFPDCAYFAVVYSRGIVQ